ncbi:MAG: 50S ribosomal protein L2, partial [Patescibacteria group bacterium]
MKKYQPTTPSRRQMSVVSYKTVLTTDTPHKPLTKGGKRFVGRNNQGRITVRHKGGGHKRAFRDVDFKLIKFNIPAKIETIEYDPNRSGFIALVVYADGERAYILAPNSLRVGDKVLISETAEIKVGNRLPLAKIPVGTFVYNVEIKPKGGAKLIRSAGTFAEVLASDAGYTSLKLPSSEV